MVLLYVVGFLGVVGGWAMVGSVPGTVVLVVAGALIGWTLAHSTYRHERLGRTSRTVPPAA